MKKALACILTLVLTISCFSSCFASKAWEDGKTKNSFFSKEHLSKFDVENFPIPKLENSYLDETDEKLYLNLTRQEYEDYVKAVVIYLQNPEEFTVSGYHCETGIFGLLIIPVPEYMFAPLNNDHIDYSLDSHLFMFSKEEIVNWHGETDLIEEKFISIKWNPTEHNSGITHTVEINFESSHLSKYLPCYHGHDFDSSTYPIAGSGKELTIYTCKFCGEKKQSEYIGSNNMTQYSITVVNGEEYVLDYDSYGYSGLLYEIKTPILIDADIRITANGTDIPKTNSEAGCWIYEFIMASENVEISVEVVGGL